MNLKTMDKKTRNILTIAFLAFIVFMYVPFLIIPVVDSFTMIDKIWDSIYEIFSPFTILPLIVGVMSLIMNIVHEKISIKLVFVALYVLSIFISLGAIFGMDSIVDGLLYLPTFIILVLHFIIWGKALKMH